MKKCFLIAMTGFLGLTAFNSDAQNVLDGIYVKEHVPTKKVIQYVHLREADVMWEKRIWRIIDTREKINFPLYFPLRKLTDRQSLFDILVTHIKERSITPYDARNPALEEFGGDQFLYPVSISDPDYELKARGLFSELGDFPNTPLVDANGNPIVMGQDSLGMDIYQYDLRDKLIKSALGNNIPLRARDTLEYESKDIIGWQLKEDWFFEKQRSVLDVRIIGICPIVASKKKGAEGQPFPLFWVYFPEIRYVIQNYFVYNRQNDAQRMSYDDLFWKRMFSSYIIKESNIYDRKIVDYTAGVDALLESEQIKKTMMELEHDVWDL
jgi:gliding motility associated protien GldN